jgi:N-acetylmuramoyl-L-alanine amidase
VLDLKEPARVASSVLKSTGKGGNRLELDLVPTGATIPGKARQSIETRAGGSEPGPVREAAAGVAGAAKHPGPPPPRSEGRRVVAVDAGHGGQDPGAIGLNDLPEKSITLSAARELKRQLEATGRYKVVMTRERDVYISLAKRVEIARAASAELFISLHADKHDNARVRGASVYTLSETASDAETEAYAKRENSSDLVAGIDLAEKYDEEVARILISLVQQSTMNCSAVFASSLVKQLKKQSRVLQRPHRFAGFRVLKAPDMPSVLVELGYLSNKSDEKMLVNSNQRSRLLKAVVLAVNSYFARQSC